MSGRAAPPSPLEWHPAYRSKTWLIGWLDGNRPDLPSDHLQIPFVPAASFTAPVTEMTVKVHQLHRERFWGPAPYVGHPFVYAWYAAVDDLGRWIAADARRMYDGHRCTIRDCGCRMPAGAMSTL